MGLDISLLCQGSLSRFEAEVFATPPCRSSSSKPRNTSQPFILFLLSFIHVALQGGLRESKHLVIHILLFFHQRDLMLHLVLRREADKLFPSHVAGLILRPPEEEGPDKSVHPLLTLCRLIIYPLLPYCVLIERVASEEPQ